MTTPSGDFHHPDALAPWKGFDEKYEKAIELAKDGVPAEDICMGVFGTSKRQFRNWIKYYQSDVEAGYDEEDSNLIKLLLGIAKEDLKLHRKLSKKGIDMALDGNSQMLQFLLKTRYGYAERSKSEVELSTEEDTNFNINIVESKPRED